MNNEFLNYTSEADRDENYPSDYDRMTELDWAEYVFDTIAYDYQIHEDAAKAIRAIFVQLYERK